MKQTDESKESDRTVLSDRISSESRLMLKREKSRMSLSADEAEVIHSGFLLSIFIQIEAEPSES